MKFSILVINNGIDDYNFKDDFVKFKFWVERNSPLELDISYTNTDFKLKFKDFGANNLSETEGKKYFGIDGVKDEIRDLNIIPLNYYHVVIFIYELSKQDTSWMDDSNALGAWAHFNGLNGAQLIEIPSLKKWEENDNLNRMLTHEIVHAWHQIARKKGIPTNDTMDMYDKEFLIDAVDGNRARNLLELKKHWSVIAAVPTLRSLILTLTIIVKLLKKQLAMKSITKKQDLLKAMATAIQKYEGWYVGSRSYRNNNPGNLRYSRFQIGTDDGNYSIFKDYDTGLEALMFQLQIAADGRSKVYVPDDTIKEFFNKYAPTHDDNNPDKYAEFVALQMGIPVETRMKELIT